MSFISVIGIMVILSLCWLISERKKEMPWRTLASGLLLQLLLAFFILQTPIGRSFFESVKGFFDTVLGYAMNGAEFLFGPLSSRKQFGFVFATMALPVIILVSSVMSVFYHLGVMQVVVKGIAWVMVRAMGTSGAESLSAAANIFAGQTEAPLVVKPYIDKMSRSELMALMVGGMATVSGGVLAAYVGMGVDAGHLLAASVMSAPAALVCAKIIVPEPKGAKRDAKDDMGQSMAKSDHENLLDAAAHGASEGMKLAINVSAMLIAFVSIVALANGGLGLIGGWFGNPDLSLELILGHVFAPIAFLLGVPWEEAFHVGSLLGKKMAINEFVAYIDLMDKQSFLSERSSVIATYALCGFSNFSSIAIQLGGIGAIAPGRRKELAQLGLKAMIAGTCATMMTACIAGLFV